MISFLVCCCGATFYLDYVDPSGVVRSSKYMEGLFEKYLHRIGVQNSVDCYNNNFILKKVGHHLMERYHIYYTPCATHCIDLILKYMCDLFHVQ